MSKHAFTLIELMVVVAIIGILLITITTGLSNAQSSSRDAQRLGDIVLIAKAIDQSATSTRGIYPHHPTDVTISTMCADQMDLTDLDLSIFPNHTVPKDPRPLVSPPTPCTSVLNGYIYNNEYNHPASGGNSAAQQSLTYTLEVTLEKTKPSEENQFKPEADLGITPYSPATSLSGRTRYILNGTYCGNTCYSK